MDPIQVLVLALVQGMTEFLPISSSAHLILVPVLTDWPDQGLAFDVAVHVGTLGAVVSYFRHQLAGMARAWWASCRGYSGGSEARLAWAVLIGTVPVGLIGILLKDWIELYLRGPLVIALATLVFGLLLGWADLRGRGVRDEHSITWRDALLIGGAQALALIPGTSRSGITMTAGLWLGLTREGAARFSFLLAIPVIVLAGAVSLADLVAEPEPVPWPALISGTLLAGVSAYVAIHYFLRLVQRLGMLPFVVYRFLLGFVLLVLYWP